MVLEVLDPLGPLICLDFFNLSPKGWEEDSSNKEEKEELQETGNPLLLEGWVTRVAGPESGGRGRTSPFEVKTG